MIHEDLVQSIAESRVIDEAHACGAGVLGHQTRDLSFSKRNVQGAKTCAERSLTTVSLSELVEVNEELFNPNSVSSNKRGEFLFNARLNLQLGRGVDERALQSSGDLPTWMTFQS